MYFSSPESWVTASIMNPIYEFSIFMSTNNLTVIEFDRGMEVLHSYNEVFSEAPSRSQPMTEVTYQPPEVKTSNQ
jgi:hypothetical protein